MFGTAVKMAPIMMKYDLIHGFRIEENGDDGSKGFGAVELIGVAGNRSLAR
jgi:hypothetical protein